MKLMDLRLTRAVSFATWFYSLLFLLYLSFRLTFNATHVHLDDLFIDRVPFFTFLITGILLLVINLASLGLYLAIRRVQRRQKGSISGKEAGRSPSSISIGFSDLNLKVLFLWSFSILIWSYLTYLSLANPPSPPYWPISLMMFVVGYVCMVYMISKRDSRVATRSA
jgi:hypothetical protein